MERPEALDIGTIMLTGFEPETVLSSVRTVIEEFSLSNAKYAAESNKENNSAQLSEILGATPREKNTLLVSVKTNSRQYQAVQSIMGNK